MSTTAISLSIIGLVAVAAAALCLLLWFLVFRKTPTTDEITETINFYNALEIDGRPVDVWLTTQQNTVRDSNDYTLWEVNPQDPSTKLVPVPDALKKSVKIPYGTYYHIPMGYSGFASLNFRIRINCDESTFVCERGDVGIVPDLDCKTGTDCYSGTSNLKRGNIPFKPDIDTKVEFTLGCIEEDKTLCRINPSCITNPSSCTYVDGTTTKTFTNLMQEHLGAKVHDDMLLYEADGVTRIPLPDGVHLANTQNFDISNVDGYTFKADIYVVRPILNAAGVKCTIQGDQVDNPSVSSAQLLLDMQTLNLEESGCPTDENLWPVAKTVANVKPGGGDGYQDLIFTQKGMSYDTTSIFVSDFEPGSTSSLKFYRGSTEIASGIPAQLGFSDYIGCGSPCSVLTKGSGDSAETQMHQVNPSRWSHTSWLQNTMADPSANDAGVREVCCSSYGLSGSGRDTFNRCNTSKLWVNSTSGDPQPSPSDNWGFGFYTINYFPRPQDTPWYPPNENPYFSPENGSKYVGAINHNLGSNAAGAVKVYAWAHDDDYKSYECVVNDPANIIKTDDGRSVYKNYKWLVVLGSKK